MARERAREERAAARIRIYRRVLRDDDFHQNRYALGLDELVVKGSRWLDLGAGVAIHGGWVGPSQADTVARAGMLVGCDVETAYLKDNPWVTCAVQGAAEALPFAGESFDIVSANMVVEHLADPAAAFSEIRRILAPTGVFVFVTPNKASAAVFPASVLLSPRVRRLTAKVVERREEKGIFPTFYRANTPSAIRKHAKAAGLNVRSLETFSSLPIMRRPLALVRMECLWIRLLRLHALRGFRSNILCCLEPAS